MMKNSTPQEIREKIKGMDEFINQVWPHIDAIYNYLGTLDNKEYVIPQEIMDKFCKTFSKTYFMIKAFKAANKLAAKEIMKEIQN